MSAVLLCVAAPAHAGVKIEQWKNVPGFEITDALAQGELDRKPDVIRQYNSFEAIADSQQPDVLRVSGLVLAPTTGEYRFMVAGDDTAVLFVSSDDSPEKLKQVAVVPAYGGRCDWDRYAAQTSAPILLTAGQRYLVCVFLKNGGGEGRVEVGWKLPGGKVEGPIPAGRVSAPSRDLPIPAYGKLQLSVTLKDDAPAAKAGFHKFPAGSKVQLPDKTVDMSYLLFLPADWETSADQKPLFIFLHGNGHQGRDLWGVLNEGPAQYLAERKDLRDWFPMVGLFPQLPDGWRWDTPGAGEFVAELTEQICRKYPRIDRNRVYLSGLSMGGKGTWLTAYASPDRFAAIAPISSVAVRPKAAAGKFAGMHTWIICGEHDHLFTQGSKDMYEAMRELGSSKVQLTVVAGASHGCWDHFYPNRSFYQELMKHRRP